MKRQQVWMLIYSQRLAMGLKLLVSLAITALLILITFNWSTAALFGGIFPAVCLITDAVLYLRRDKIYNDARFAIKDENIPESYKMNVQELLSFARNFPKVRFCRLVSGVIFGLICMVCDKKLMLFETFIMFPFICYPMWAILDPFWAKRLKVKIPHTVRLSAFNGAISSSSPSHQSSYNWDNYTTRLVTGQVPGTWRDMRNR